MGESMRVLVVDDELGIREGCRRALTPHGFEVEVAENGPIALRKLREGPFDVLLLDAMIPGMSGLEVLRQVRQIDPHLICIIITGYATVELAVQAIREGAHDFIAKPFNSELLLQVVNRELERRQLRHEAERVQVLEEETRELARAKRERSPLSLLMLDLDLFKIVNDTYGHMAGDLVLRETAQRLSASVRAYDAVSRYGGEEFLIVSPGCPAAGAVNLAERIRKVVGEKPMNTSEALISITISVGIATAEYVDKRATFTKSVGEYTEAENLVRAADDAMYRAKRWGRNRVESNTVNLARKP